MYHIEEQHDGSWHVVHSDSGSRIKGRSYNEAIQTLARLQLYTRGCIVPADFDVRPMLPIARALSALVN